MTERERVLTALRHARPDKTPYQLDLTDLVYERLREHYDDDDFFEKTGFGELNPRDINWINEAVNRDDVDYSVEYYMVARK